VLINFTREREKDKIEAPQFVDPFFRLPHYVSSYYLSKTLLLFLQQPSIPQSLVSFSLNTSPRSTHLHHPSRLPSHSHLQMYYPSFSVLSKSVVELIELKNRLELEAKVSIRSDSKEDSKVSCPLEKAVWLW